MPKSTPKNVEKTVAETVVRTNIGRGGAPLKVGNPGNKGGTGRPPNWWKAECAELASLGAQAARAKQILEDPDHPAWLGAWRFVAEQAHGKPTQPLSGTEGQPLEIRVTYDPKPF
jgi:hypothetical protein